MRRHPKQAIVLSGGGAQGAYAVGVMEALFSGQWNHGTERPLMPSYFAGTSVGAYSAAVLAQSPMQRSLDAVRYLKSVWLEEIASVPGRKKNGVFRIRGSPFGYRYCRQESEKRHRRGSFSSAPRLVASDFGTWASKWLLRGLSISLADEPMVRGALRTVDVQDFVSAGPLEELISRTVDVGELLRLDNGLITITATGWDSGTRVFFTNHSRDAENVGFFSRGRRVRLDADNTHKAILASAAIPGFFPPVLIGGEKIVDGGLILNTPLAPAIDAGAEEIHVIQMESKLSPIPIGRPSSLLETFERMMAAVPSDSLRWDLLQARRTGGLRSAAQSVAKLLACSRNELSTAERRDIDTFIQEYVSRPKIVVHRHFPKNYLGGAQSIFNFDQSKIIEMMEEGFSDAVRHDCQENGCIL